MRKISIITPTKMLFITTAVFGNSMLREITGWHGTIRIRTSSLRYCRGL